MDLTRLTEELKSAVLRFQTAQTPENFFAIVTALRTLGLSGQDLWRELVRYTREHPVRVALAVGVLFYAIKGMVESANPRQLADSH